jgi:hypothetical protein
VLSEARAKAERETALSLDAWEADHRARIDRILAENGYRD